MLDENGRNSRLQKSNRNVPIVTHHGHGGTRASLVSSTVALFPGIKREALETEYKILFRNKLEKIL